MDTCEIDRETVTEIVIPDGVTYIGSRAFKDSAYLTTLTIPSSVKAIGYSAFRECVNLKDITMQEGVEDIRDGAFDGCNAPPSLVIPESVTSIGAYAFYACPSSCNVRFYNTMEQVLSIPNAPWGISVNTILHCSNGDLYVKTTTSITTALPTITSVYDLTTTQENLLMLMLMEVIIFLD